MVDVNDPACRLVRTAREAPAVPVLDDAQRAVVEHDRGPLLVLAGPGTGKTTTLVESVVRRAAAGVPVEQMLMLTFSRRAAAEMRTRVSARLGASNGQGAIREPLARTLHSYAFGVLRLAALRNGDPTPRLLAATEQDVVIRDLLAGGDHERWPAALRLALGTYGFAAELRDLLMRAVERGLDGPALRRLGERRGRADWVAAGDFLAEYHGVTVLRDPGGYDPAELIQAALGVLRSDPELLAAERMRRRRIFVDEYQDTDPAQADLLQLLSDGADELVLVGDPDQSIYAFRGADESAIHDVDERYGAGETVPTVALRQCRRSGPVLLAASRRIAGRLPGRGEQRTLVPADGLPPGQLQVAVFRSAAEEAAHIAGTLRAAYLEGTPWSQMAVLVRSTAQTLGTLRRAMITAGVPVAVRGDDLPLAEQPAVTLLLTLLRWSLAPDAMSTEDAEQLLVGPLGGADTLYLRRLRRVLRRDAPDQDDALVDVLADVLADEAAVAALPDGVRGPVARVHRVIAAGRQAAATGADTEHLLWALWAASGLARRWERASLFGGTQGTAADRDLDAVVALFDEVARFTDRLPGSPPARFVEHLLAQQLSADPFVGNRAQPEAVSIVTAHASKGLEWDVVCVAGVHEGTWPDLRRRGSLLGAEQLVDAVRGVDGAALASLAPQLAEERRLFYVAVTRARHQLLVTASAGQDEQPSRFLDELDPRADDLGRPPVPPIRGVHLPGLVAELRAVVCGGDAVGLSERAAAAQELARLADAGVAGADPDDWWGLAPLSTEDGVVPDDRAVRVTPSSIDAFFTCELQALMRLLGVNDKQSAAAGLGNLVHELAEAAPDDVSLEQLTSRLDERWGSLDFGAAWHNSNERERAVQMLDRLVTWLRASRDGLELVGVEVPFRVRVGDAEISGRVDRLERDAQGRLVVIDLKTGSTNATDVDEHPQLGAYQLAIEAAAFASAADGSPAESGGARLVQLGTRLKGVQQVQAPLAETADPQLPLRRLEEMAARLRGHEFVAVDNKRCHVCDAKSACPLQDAGRQVTS